MNLKTYLNLYTLLKEDRSTREERRAFSLENQILKKHQARQLEAWLKKHQHQIDTGKAEEMTHYLYGVTLVLVVVAFILGLLSGVALLNYSGDEPINVVYFMAMVIIMPILTMTLSLFSMFRANKAQSALVHISPAFWMEKILGFFSKEAAEEIRSMKVSPLLANWIVIQRSQLIALVFSLGLFVALISLVVTKDIAFAWSTTLDISAKDFYAILQSIALPWREWMPTAVPSLELIEQSHYFRLGEKLSEEMISHAKKLGEWWKFLAMATLFYAIFLRVLLYLASKVGYRRALRRSLLGLKGVGELLRDMNEPLIMTRTQDQQTGLSPISATMQIVKQLDSSYDTVLGWALNKAQLWVMLDTLGIQTSRVVEVGGSKSLEEDQQAVSGLEGKILLVVKAWEPPTMDFMDFVEILAKKVEKVIIVPLGTAKQEYRVQHDDLMMWMDKLAALHLKNIWIKV